MTIWHAEQASTASGEVSSREILLWDRKRDGGFPGMFNLLSFLFSSTLLAWALLVPDGFLSMMSIFPEMPVCIRGMALS